MKTPLAQIKENKMKRYTIGLMFLFTLISTGCEDAKAESKDYDIEIAELRALIDAMPKTTHYECVMGSDNICTIEIPGFDPNENFTYSIILTPFEYDRPNNNWFVNKNKLVAEPKGEFLVGKYVYDTSGKAADYTGTRVVLSITK